MDMHAYLGASAYIDWHHPAVADKAKELASGCTTEAALIRKCFEFVRDQIEHSWDFKFRRCCDAIP